MPLLFNFESISNISFFDFIDFTIFSDFEKLVSVIGFNILYYVFLIFIFNLCYKVLCRIWSIIF